MYDSTARVFLVELTRRRKNRIRRWDKVAGLLHVVSGIYRKFRVNGGLAASVEMRREVEWGLWSRVGQSPHFTLVEEGKFPPCLSPLLIDFVLNVCE